VPVEAAADGADLARQLCGVLLVVHVVLRGCRCSGTVGLGAALARRGSRAHLRRHGVGGREGGRRDGEGGWEGRLWYHLSCPTRA
jgi:hypothetical protein